MILEQTKYNYILTVSKFRVKIKSLAEEARIIRFEKQKRKSLCVIKKWPLNNGTYIESVNQSLGSHNREVVRREQRHTLLAYAFYRGKPYSSIEGKTNNPPEAHKIKRILGSLSGKSDLTEILNWLKS